MSIAPCPPPSTPPRGVVVFSAAAFKVAFPQFAATADAVLNLAFSVAQLQLNNTCGSRVCNAAERETLLNLLVAHIAQLMPTAGSAGLVGRVSDATEGSVSVSTDMGTIVYGQAYYMQTQWGAMYWQSTAKYRTARYIPPPPVCADVAAAGPFGPQFSGNGFGGGNGCGC
jgi:hypothetical protein